MIGGDLLSPGRAFGDAGLFKKYLTVASNTGRLCNSLSNMRSIIDPFEKGRRWPFGNTICCLGTMPKLDGRLFDITKKMQGINQIAKELDGFAKAKKEINSFTDARKLLGQSMRVDMWLDSRRSIEKLIEHTQSPQSVNDSDRTSRLIAPLAERRAAEQEREERMAKLVAEQLARILCSKPTAPQRETLSVEQANAEMTRLIDKDESRTKWTAKRFRVAIEADGTKKTSETTIKKTTMWKKLMENTGRGRKRRVPTQSEDGQLLDRLISQQTRERNAESGKSIRGRNIMSRD